MVTVSLENSQYKLNSRNEANCWSVTRTSCYKKSEVNEDKWHETRKKNRTNLDFGREKEIRLTLDMRREI